MLFNSRDIDVVKVYFAVSAKAIACDAVPTAAVKLAVVDVTEYAEVSFGLFRFGKMIFVKKLSYLVRESIGNIGYLLPQNKVHIDALVKIGICKIFLLVSIDIFVNGFANVGQLFIVDLVCLFKHVLFKQYEIDNVFAVIQSAKKTVFSVFAIA